MNDYELHYMYRARSSELQTEAEANRRAALADRGRANRARPGPAARLAERLGRGKARRDQGRARYRLAK